MAKKTEKTNAARLLDKAGISYNLIPYEFDENDLAAQHVADSLGQPIEQVFKTLVARGASKGIYVFVIPVGATLNLKRAANACGEDTKHQLKKQRPRHNALIKFPKTHYISS